MSVTLAINELLESVEERQRKISNHLDTKERARLGQFFTPTPVAEFIASLPALPQAGKVNILDPGAGVGALTAAMIARIATERPDLEIAVTAFEIDNALRSDLEITLSECETFAKELHVPLTTRILMEDFLSWAAHTIPTSPLENGSEVFDIVIMNPPYRKMNTNTNERRALTSIAVEVTNLYAAFVAMSVALLSQDGQLAAITPRSFANGPYFRSFRRFFFDNMAFDRLHIYESRSKAFSYDEVLQENVIFGARRKNPDEVDSSVTVSASHGPIDSLTTRIVLHSEIVKPGDPERFVHIITSDADAALGTALIGLPTRIADLVSLIINSIMN